MLRGWYTERIVYEHYERKFSHINTCNPAWILIYKWLPESLQLVLCSMRITFSNEFLIDLILKMWIWVSPLLTGKNSIMLFQFCHCGCSPLLHFNSFSTFSWIWVYPYGGASLHWLACFPAILKGRVPYNHNLFWCINQLGVCWLFSPLRMLPSIHGVLDRTCNFLQHFFWGIISVANISLNLAAILVICPLIFGWLILISWYLHFIIVWCENTSEDPTSICFIICF